MNGPRTTLDGDRAIVALTFDDGPHPEGTVQVLAALEELGLPATFFVLGENVVRHPGPLEALLAAGLDVGVHGWDHTDPRGASPDLVDDQIGRTCDELRRRGTEPRWYRPPFGHWDRGVLEAAERAGLETVLWSVDSLDWQSPEPDVLVDRVLSGLTPGAIVLLHDGGSGSRTGTAAALPRLAWFLRDAAGYEVVDLRGAGR